MITVNILAVSHIKDLFEKILNYKKKYSVSQAGKLRNRISIDTPYLKTPTQYDINLLPKKEFLPYMYEALEFIKENTDDNDPSKFREIEYTKFQRVVKYMETSEYPKLKLLQ